jgi:hypothetical protein
MTDIVDRRLLGRTWDAEVARMCVRMVSMANHGRQDLKSGRLQSPGNLD